jgi:hypothetical protein
MHRKTFVALAAFGAFSLLVSSCSFFSNMQVPESVAVKTDAKYSVPLGKASYDISSVFGKDTLKTSMQNSLGSTSSIYDYVLSPTDDTLSYLLHYPVYRVPVDIGSYLDSLDLSSALDGDKGIAFSQSIALPTVAINQTQEIDIPDVSAKILSSMNETLAKGDTSYSKVPEPGTTGVPASTYMVDSSGKSHNSITIEGALANTITYETGSAVEIAVTRTDSNAVTSNYSFTLTATISSGTTTYATASKDIANGGTLVLDFGGNPLPKTLLVTLDGTLNNGTFGVTHAYDVKMSLSSDTKVKKISGITASASDLGINPVSINQTVDLSDMVGYFTSATIGTGSVAIQSGATPSTWNGISISGDITMSGAGMSSTRIDDVSGSSNFIDKYANLSTKTLAPTESDKSLAVAGTLSLQIASGTASIEFVNGSSAQKIPIAITCGVSTLSSANIDFTSSKVSKSYSLPTDGSSGSVAISSELLNYVKEIDFCNTDDHYKHASDGTKTSTLGKGFGVTCNVVNSLPAGNDLPITLTSNFFKYNKSASLDATGSDTATAETWNDYPLVDNLSTYDKTVTHYVDFSFALGSSATLHNLVMGSTYSFGISDVKLLYDWDTVTLDLSGQKVEGTKDMSFLNLSSLLSALPISSTDLKKIQVTALPVYFYAQKPTATSIANSLGDISFTGTINTTYDYLDSNNTTVSMKKAVLGTMAPDGTISEANAPCVDNITWPTDTSTAITSSSDVTSHLKYVAGDKTGASFTKDFAEIINDSPKNMNLNYSLTMKGSGGDNVKLYATAVDEVKNSSSEDKTLNIDIDMVAVLSFNLKLTDAISMDIMSYLDSTWETDYTTDLLKRDSGSTYEAYTKYVNAIEYVGMEYTVTNNLIPDLNLSMKIVDHGTNANVKAGNALTKDIPFTSGSNSFQLSSDEIEGVMTEAGYPFHPYINIVLGKSGETTSLNLQRAAISSSKAFEAQITAVVKMDGDTPITVWGGKE